MTMFKCEYCGVEFEGYESQRRKYCCSDCCYKDRMRKNNLYKIKKCKYCGNEFRSKYKEQQFCSRECVNKHQEMLVGELSPKYNHSNTQCEICGKVYSVKQSKIGKQRFCSKECKNVWYNEYKRTPDKIKEQSKTIIRLLAEGKIKNTLTKPHIMINEVLDELGIKYKNEYNIVYYSVDIYLSELKLMIEIMGDYWHSNPTTKYKNAKNKQQQSRIGKDKAKHSYIKNQFNIEVLYLWEHDILNRIDLCKQLIKKYIYNNGMLEDYNSFNYSIVEDDISLNENIISPLFAL